MARSFLALTFVLALTLATGCGFSKKAAVPATRGVAAFQATVVEAQQRYIAERHKLEVITSATELQKSWESAIAFCGTIQCEIISSSITTRGDASLPFGSLSLRVAPQDLSKFLANVEKLGKVAQHNTEREDKTTAVVDTDAKIKNLTAFRDNLRAMLAKPSATVKDLVDIQKQLTDTQSELDSETTQRKILTNETEKIAVEISFSVQSQSQAAGSQIWNALRDSSSILADSTASLIMTIVAVLPWLIVVLPVVWLLAKVWRKLKSRRNRSVVPERSSTNT